MLGDYGIVHLCLVLNLVTCFLCCTVWEHLIQREFLVCELQWVRSNPGCLMSDFLSISQSEEKIKTVPSLYGILMTLNHMVQQDYFPKSLAPVLSAFVTK